MPTYEYRCKSCKHKFEVFHSMTANPDLVCPNCGSSVEKLIGTGAGPIFKGKGFYQTDYKNSSSKTNPDNSKKAEPIKAKPSKSESIPKSPEK